MSSFQIIGDYTLFFYFSDSPYISNMCNLTKYSINQYLYASYPQYK